jgi:hypothetical protein
MGWTAHFITEKDKEFKKCIKLKPPAWITSIYFKSYDVKGEAITEVLEIYQLEKDKFIVIRRDVKPTNSYILIRKGRKRYSIPVVEKINTAFEFMDKNGVEHVINYITDKYVILFP